jgi:hypothetical protein
MIGFGTGRLSVTPEIGEAADFGIVQDVTIDINYSKKELYGENQFPVDIARTQGKINIKAKAAKIDARLFNAVFCHGAVETAGNATTVTVTNQPMGAAPWFALSFETIYHGRKMKFEFPRCNSSKLGLSFKQEDYTIPDFDMDAFADDDGRLYTWTSVE